VVAPFSAVKDGSHPVCLAVAPTPVCVIYHPFRIVKPGAEFNEKRVMPGVHWGGAPGVLHPLRLAALPCKPQLLFDTGSLWGFNDFLRYQIRGE